MALLQKHQFPQGEGGKRPHSIVFVLVSRAAMIEERMPGDFNSRKLPLRDLESQCEVTGKSRALRIF